MAERNYLEELQRNIINAKADELSYTRAAEDTHDKLMMTIGILEGYKQGYADGERYAKGITEIKKES